MRNGDVNHGLDQDRDRDIELGVACPGRRYNVIVVAFRLSRSVAGVKSG